MIDCDGPVEEESKYKDSLDKENILVWRKSDIRLALCFPYDLDINNSLFIYNLSNKTSYRYYQNSLYTNIRVFNSIVFDDIIQGTDQLKKWAEEEGFIIKNDVSSIYPVKNEVDFYIQELYELFKKWCMYKQENRYNRIVLYHDGSGYITNSSSHVITWSFIKNGIDQLRLKMD